MLKSSVVFFCFNLNLYDLLMGGPRTLHFHDFGTFGRAPEPQHQYYLYLESPGYFKKYEENPKSFWGVSFWGNMRIANVEKFGNMCSNISKFRTLHFAKFQIVNLLRLLNFSKFERLKPRSQHETRQET